MYKLSDIPIIAIIILYLTANNFRFVLWFAVIPAVLCIVVLIFGVKETTLKKNVLKKKYYFLFKNFSKITPVIWLFFLTVFILNLGHFSEAFLLLRSQEIGLKVSFKSCNKETSTLDEIKNDLMEYLNVKKSAEKENDKIPPINAKSKAIKKETKSVKKSPSDIEFPLYIQVEIAEENISFSVHYCQETDNMTIKLNDLDEKAD